MSIYDRDWYWQDCARKERQYYNPREFRSQRRRHGYLSSSASPRRSSSALRSHGARRHCRRRADLAAHRNWWRRQRAETAARRRLRATQEAAQRAQAQALQTQREAIEQQARREAERQLRKAYGRRRLPTGNVWKTTESVLPWLKSTARNGHGFGTTESPRSATTRRPSSAPMPSSGPNALSKTSTARGESTKPHNPTKQACSASSSSYCSPRWAGMATTNIKAVLHTISSSIADARRALDITARVETKPIHAKRRSFQV